MIKKRQRLMRFIRRGRQERTHLGGIEHLMPSRLSGWAISLNDPFHEVRLLVGSVLIACVEINQEREDVCQEFHCNTDPGFILDFPIDLPSVDWDKPIRLLALSVDGHQSVELFFLSEPDNTSTRLRNILQSDFLSVEGHFDGVVNGALQGWAARKGQKTPISIWIYSDDIHQDPIKVICDEYRDEIDNSEFPRQCGFRLPLSKLSDSWRGLSVQCSFDRDGKFILPQNQIIYIPDKKFSTVISSSQGRNVSTFMLDDKEYSAYPSQKNWDELLIFRLILDEVENKLDMRDRAEEQKRSIPSRHHWFRRFFFKSSHS